MMKRVALVFVVLVAIRSTANSAVYQWVDEKGGVHFSDQQQLTNRGASSPASFSAPRPRSFSIPQHGSLVLNVPESWDHEIRQPRENLPPTIVLTPRDGDDFEVLITPIWSPNKEPGFNSPQVTKRLVSTDLQGMLPTAVEREVTIKEFQGKQGAGYYFLVTDKAPGSGYPYAVRAGIGVGDLLLSVTVLCRTKDSEGLTQTLKALQGAVQIKA